MKRLFVMAALAAAGCGAEPAANPPEGSTPVVLATFTGEVDMASGTVTIQSEPTALGQALGMKAMVVPAGTPGVTVANVAGTLWNNTQTGCGTTPTSGANVRVTSNYASPTSLSNVYAEITALTPSSAAACNSAAAIPGVTAANGGLWSYGNISAGANAVKTWAFTLPRPVSDPPSRGASWPSGSMRGPPRCRGSSPPPSPSWRGARAPPSSWTRRTGRSRS